MDSYNEWIKWAIAGKRAIYFLLNENNATSEVGYENPYLNMQKSCDIYRV